MVVELEAFELSAAQKPILVQTHLHLVMCSPQILSLSLSSPPLPDLVIHLKGIHHQVICHVRSHACICTPSTMVLPYPASHQSADFKRHYSVFPFLSGPYTVNIFAQYLRLHNDIGRL